MIQGLIPAAPSAPGIPSAPAAPAVPDKNFSMVLKASLHNPTKADDSAKMVSSEESAEKDVSVPANTSTSKVSENRQGSGIVKDSAENKETQQAQPKQDSNEILRQLVLQMSAIAQQIVNQPVLKDMSEAAAALASQGVQAAQAAQSAQAVLMPTVADLLKENAQLSSAVQAVSGPVTAAHGENYLAALAVKQDGSADKIDFKLPDKISANSKDALLGALKSASQDNSTNAIPPAADSAKTEAELQSFSQSGKDAATISRTAGSAGDASSEFKIEVSDGSASSQSSGDKGREATGLYAQSIQTQTVSGHEQAPIQETVPANRLNSLDEVIAKAVDSGQKNLVIRIDPPDLGSMHIRLSLDNGVLKAEVRVDSSSVKDSFNLALPQIKTALENSGIRVSEFHVDVREDQYRNGQERNNQAQQQKQGRGSKNGFSDFFA